MAIESNVDDLIKLLQTEDVVTNDASNNEVKRHEADAEDKLIIKSLDSDQQLSMLALLRDVFGRLYEEHKDLVNPVVSFNWMHTITFPEDYPPRTDTILAKSSDDEYARMRQCVEKASLNWRGKERADAHVVAPLLLGYFMLHPDELCVLSACKPFFKYVNEDKEVKIFDAVEWFAKRKSNTAAVLKDLLPSMMAFKSCSIGGFVRNPLYEITLAEKEGRKLCEGKAERDEVLEKADALSRNLWHSAASLPEETLAGRMLFAPDYGAALLDQYSDLRRRISGEAP